MYPWPPSASPSSSVIEEASKGNRYLKASAVCLWVDRSRCHGVFCITISETLQNSRLPRSHAQRHHREVSAGLCGVLIFIKHGLRPPRSTRPLLQGAGAEAPPRSSQSQGSRSRVGAHQYHRGGPLEASPWDEVRGGAWMPKKPLHSLLAIAEASGGAPWYKPGCRGCESSCEASQIGASAARSLHHTHVFQGDTTHCQHVTCTS